MTSTTPQRHGLTVRHKFLAAFIVAAFLPLAVFGFIAFRSTSRALERQEQVDMNNRAGGILAVLDRTGRAGVDQLVSHGVSDEFCRAIDRRDVGWIEDNVTAWVPQDTALKAVQVLTPEGEMLAAGGQLRGASVRDVPAVRAAMKGTRGFDVETVNGRLFILSAGPVVEENRAASPVHGVVVFGQPVDEALLAEVATYIGASQLSLYVADRLVATSGGEDPAPIPAGVQPGEPFTNGSRTLVLQELRDKLGGVRAVLSMAVETSALSITNSTLRETMWLAMLAALAVALTFGLLMSTAISRPLRRLAQAAAAIAGGETHQHIEVKSTDEIGEVADAFNTMSERITHDLEGMAGKIRGLSVEIASLSTFGETLAQMPDVRTELRRLTEMVAEVFSADFATLYLDEEPFGLVAAAGYGDADGAQAAADHLVATVSATGEPTLGGRRDAERPGAGTLIAAPIVPNGRMTGALALGANNGILYHDEDLALLEAVAGQIAIALRHAEVYAKLDAINLQTVTALAAAMEAKDHYTAEHADSLASMAAAVGRRLGLSEGERRELQYAAVLHDIGKIGVPGTILNKPGKLTEDEFALMAEHTLIGERIISRIEYLRPVARIVRSAHERWDGCGYPDQLAADDIPLGSRVLLACDAFHAMTSDRPYRRAMPEEEALAELRRNSGTQFDPEVVRAFFDAAVSRVSDGALAH